MREGERIMPKAVSFCLHRWAEETKRLNINQQKELRVFVQHVFDLQSKPFKVKKKLFAFSSVAMHM